ncbi:uncharacterized protein LOC116564595 [Sapajus apella]|uniref:Uncharacterized protein LOC116564595 n=1 Tax=Sapajus apella TaxID=9515 RepID=A0A6J3JG12_SAPAP|nr:uncharacterized protein LOC116564595 [Sapajus apella]
MEVSKLMVIRRAPGSLGGEVFGAEVPSLQKGRLLPLRTPGPAAKAVSAAAPRGTGLALPLTPSGPAAPVPARAPRPRSTERPEPIARATELLSSLPPPESPAGPSGCPDKGYRGAQRPTPGRACLPPSPAHRQPPVARKNPRCLSSTPSLPWGGRSGRAQRVAAKRPRHARAEEGAAAATMSARPSQKRGAQRTKRSGGAGGAGAQADPADPRGISGARSPGNPAP